MKDFHGTGGFAKVCSRNAMLQAGRVTRSKSISKLSIKIPLGIGQNSGGRCSGPSRIYGAPEPR